MKRWIKRWGFDVLAAMAFLTAAVVAGCQATGASSPKSQPAPVSIEQNSADFRYAGGLQTGVNGNLASAAPSPLVASRLRGEAALDALPVPPSSLPNASEELWIISKPAKAQAAEPVDMPRSGALVVKDGEKVLPFPLKHTDVRARIDGYIATVEVRQQYVNPFDTKIEAVYVFPLPENAAVNEFVMTVGDRVIRGIIREREEAKQIYEAAKHQGYVASLLEQERPNVFTQKVANIEPGKQVDIGIKYFHTLAYTDGWYEFVFPMVVGPRFNPPGTTDGIGAVARGERNASGQKTEVQYLSPDERTGHDISLQVDLNAGVRIEDVRSLNHAIETSPFPPNSDLLGPNARQISLSAGDRIPNKDFVLRYKVAGETLKSAVIAERDSKGGGYFALMLYPPTSTEQLARRPVDLCFTLDVSGSMSGAPIEQSRAAMRAALGMMREDDTFNIIRFAGGTDQFAASSVQATPENIRSAQRFIANMNAGGGTMMLEGIRRSLNQSVDENRVRYVCMMTDGFIGNEREIIQATRQMRGATRVFGFGVGSSPNRYLLDGMSRAGAGAVAYLSLNEKGEDVMRPFFERISRPALTEIEVDASGLKGAQINPFKVPDVYVGRAVVVTGRFEGEGGSITVRGRADGQVISKAFEIKPTSEGTAIASVWARQQIASLCDAAMFDDANLDLPKEIKSIALNYSLMSDYTSFVAVDSTHRTAGETGVTVQQPVPVPDGVRYDTTVQGNDGTADERR